MGFVMDEEEWSGVGVCMGEIGDAYDRGRFAIVKLLSKPFKDGIVVHGFFKTRTFERRGRGHTGDGIHGADADPASRHTAHHGR